MWQSYTPPPSATAKLQDTFSGTVREVVSGDCLVVADSAAGGERFEWRIWSVTCRLGNEVSPIATAKDTFSGNIREVVSGDCLVVADLTAGGEQR